MGLRDWFAAAAALCLLLAPGLAWPQQVMLCGLRSDMGNMLAQRFGERPQAGGLVGDRIVELLVSPSGSWSILITSADGRSCVMTGGDDWSSQPLGNPLKLLHPHAWKDAL